MEIVRRFKSLELFAFTYCSTITIGVTFLPYMNHVEVRSAWLKVLVGVVPYFILILFLKKFTQKYESYDFFAELKKAIWKPIFIVIVLYFIVSCFLATHYIVEALALLTNTYLLPKTEIWVITLLFLLVVIVGLMYGIAPIIAVIQSLPSQGGVFERLDLFFLGFWIIAYFKIVVIQLWFLQFLMNKLYPEKKPGMYIIMIVSLLFFGTTITPTFIEQQWQPLTYNQLIYTILLPLLLLVFLILKKKKGVGQSETG